MEESKFRCAVCGASQKDAATRHPGEAPRPTQFWCKTCRAWRDIEREKVGASGRLDLVGKRFGCDFLVVASGIGTVDGKHVPLAVLSMLQPDGSYRTFEISVEELATVVERGLVAEIPDTPKGRAS